MKVTEDGFALRAGQQERQPLRWVRPTGCPSILGRVIEGSCRFLGTVVYVQRLVCVEFGPSKSKRFGRAVAEAKNGPGECSELEPGRYRARFPLEEDATVFTGLARLLERVRHWRATEVYEDGELVSVFHAKEMAWCASFYLGSFGVCRERFDYGVLPRCAVCPLFDSGRAVRAGFRAGPAPGQRVEIGCGEDAFEIGPEPDFTIVTDIDFVFNPDVLALLDGQIPDWMDLGGLVPDFPPDEWGESGADERAD